MDAMTILTAISVLGNFLAIFGIVVNLPKVEGIGLFLSLLLAVIFTIGYLVQLNPLCILWLLCTLIWLNNTNKYLKNY